MTGSVEELYDISSDPGETHDVAGEHPDLLPKLREVLHQWRTAHPSRQDPHPVPMTDELRETLRALGYLPD